jgi:hypothetical protein
MTVSISVVIERWLKGKKNCLVASVAFSQSRMAYYSFSKYLKLVWAVALCTSAFTGASVMGMSKRKERCKSCSPCSSTALAERQNLI